MKLEKIDKKKVRDYLFKGVIVLVFLGLAYSIFSSDEDKGETNNIGLGLNTELPDGKAEPLKEKMSAYESTPSDEAREQQMKSLDDYAFSLKANQSEKEAFMDETDVELTHTSSGASSNAGLEALKTSIQVRQMQDVGDYEYNQLANEKAKLETQVYKLEKELERKKRSEEQMAMMEKSYEMASRLVGSTASAKQEDIQMSDELPVYDVVDVERKDNNIVSTLAEELLLNAPYNHGFNTAVGSGYQIGTNTIRAAVSEDQTVTVGQRVLLRLLEPLQAGNVTIPRNHQIAGTTQIQGDRMSITIESLEYAGSIIPVKLKVYDTDGMPGIYCPGSIELDAVKEGAANIGSGLGSSISFTQSAGQQIAMDLTRGVMNGASQYVSKKLRTVKVTLKSNYEVLLLPQKQ